MMTGHCSHYAAFVAGHARALLAKCRAAGGDVAPWLWAAWASIEGGEAQAGVAGPYVDEQGHTRPVYAALAAHLGIGAGGVSDRVGVYWRAVLGLVNGAAVDAALREPTPDGALRALGDEDSLDSWTYDELTGLHALAILVARTGRRDWRGRMKDAAMHHLYHTQPDHVTTQPWGVAAFFAFEETTSFGEQQVHDAITHAASTGHGLLSAVILADAARTLRNLAARAQA